jgi:hypothetical protein
MIFNYSLSAGQISAIYGETSPRFVATSGTHTFNIDLSGNTTANISLGNYVVPPGTNISAQMTIGGTAGEEINFTNGVITNYTIPVGSGTSGTIKITYYTDTNKFLSPIAGGNITIDAWNASVSSPTDTTAPTISMVYPSNTTYSTAVSQLNYTVSDETALSSCWYSLNGGANSTTQTCGTNWTGLTSTQGTNIWFVYANDTSNNINYSVKQFFVDSISPTISYGVLTESNASTIVRNNIVVNVTSTDTNLANITIRLYNSARTLLQSNTSSSAAFLINYTGLADGTYYFNASATDVLNNINNSETYSVVLDTTSPSISMVYPANISYNSAVTQLNYTASDNVVLSSCWYSLNGASNVSITCGNNATGLTASEGSNTWIVYANDTVNNLNSSSVTFFVDTISPTIDYGVLTESNNSNISRSNIIVNATSVDTNLANITIRLYDSSKALLQSNTTAANPNFINYTGLSDGIYYFNATSTDILNNKNNSATYLIRIDTANPGIVYGNLADNSSNVSRNWIYVNVSITEANEANVTFTLYNTTGVVNVTTFGAGNRNINFTSLSDGTYTFNVSAADTLNHVNTTETRTVNVDTTTPLIAYGIRTENNNEVRENSSGIYVNVTWIETNLANMTFSLYTNGGTTVNTTVVTSASYSINWTGLNAGAYRYQINITDSSNNRNATTVRNITLLDSCFNAQGSQCNAEGQDCNITTSCYLYSSLCSGNVCDFQNFRINGTLYTLYDNSGNGNELFLNLSNITFIKSTVGNRGNYTQGIVFNGKTGSTISPGTAGGNASRVNVTVPYFLNTTRANFTGLGGYSTLSGSVGGNGGLLYLQFFGLIRNFSDNLFGGSKVIPILPAGSSVDSGAGSAGAYTLGKIIDCSYLGKRDVDVSDDGVVNDVDYNHEFDNYNNVTGDNTFVPEYDISCDGKLNIIEVAKIGFQVDTR